MNFIEFIQGNFWHVAPILIAGAFAIAIFAERFRALFSVYPIKDSQGFFDKIGDLGDLRVLAQHRLDRVHPEPRPRREPHRRQRMIA